MKDTKKAAKIVVKKTRVNGKPRGGNIGQEEKQKILDSYKAKLQHLNDRTNVIYNMCIENRNNKKLLLKRKSAVIRILRDIASKVEEFKKSKYFNDPYFKDVQHKRSYIYKKMSVIKNIYAIASKKKPAPGEQELVMKRIYALTSQSISNDKNNSYHFTK